MSIKTGVTTGTPAKIPFGAGVYFEGVTYSETVAPTEEEVRAKLLGATQDGGSMSITPEFFVPELDGVTVAVAELEEKVGEKAQMEVSFAELSPELVAKQVIGNISKSEDGNYDVITSSDKIAPGHYYEGFGFYGEQLDGRPMIVMFKKALCTSGHTMENKNKTNTVFKGTIECRSDLEYGTTKLPYVIFIRKEAGWVKEDVANVEVQE